jgi:DNA-binding NtrC family response regulator
LHIDEAEDADAAAASRNQIIASGGSGHLNALTRITLAGNSPEELARLVSLFGIECGVEVRDQQRLTTARISGVHEAAAPLRLAIGPNADAGAADFVCDSPYPAACMILSRVLGMPVPLLTADPEMFSVLQAALAAAPGCAPVLIDGETGVGKKSLARIIHAASGSADEPVYIDCAAIDDSHEAFFRGLDAESESRADQGAPRTIILDRIAELPAAGQSRLLASIRLAADRGPARNPVRFIAAAARSLIGMGQRGEFLAELRGMFDVTLAIPPLRRRRKDVPVLARHFLRGISAAASLDAGAVRALQDYPFPGNVRELRNLITRLAILTRPPSPDAGGPNQEIITEADVHSQIAGLYRVAGADSVVWKLTRERVRREMAIRALAAAGGNQYKAAANLGVEPPALMRLTAAAAASKSRRPRGGLA